MSVRNPTSWIQFNSESPLQSRQTIKTTIPSLVADDQVYILDAPQMVVSAAHAPWRTDDTASYLQIGIIEAPIKALCDQLPAATTANCKWAAYAWAGDAAITEFKLNLSDGTTNSGITVNADLTTKKWRGFSASVAWTESGYLTLSAYVSGGGAGGRYIYCSGLYVYSEET